MKSAHVDDVALRGDELILGDRVDRDAVLCRNHLELVSEARLPLCAELTIRPPPVAA